jgi:hypothetical protein
MLPAVEFNDQPFFKTDEIGDIWSDGFLAAELQTVDSLAPKMPPQEFLSVGLSLPE